MQVFIHAALLLALFATPILSQDLPPLGDDIGNLDPTTPASNTTTTAAPASNTTSAANATRTSNTTSTGNLTAANTTNGTMPAAAAPPKPKPATGGCTRICRRREIRDLSSGERQAYFAAVRKIQEGSAPTKYDNLVKIHMDAQEFSHNSAHFLPWHRGYLREYEKALQEVDPTVCVPYYNSAVDSQAPEYSPVWDDDYYGGNGGSGGCVGNGAFAGWRPYYPQPHCLQRKWIHGNNLGSFYSIESLNQVVSANDDYDSFRENLEMMVHPIVHNNVGGDLSEMYSPNDPLFWSHHAYMDYVWTQWQRYNGYSFHGPSSSGGSAQSSDSCQGLPYKVQDVLDHTKLCYGYDDLGEEDINMHLPNPTVPAPEPGQKPDKTYVESIPDEDDDTKYSSQDRTKLNTLRYPDRIGEAWAAKNRYDIGKLRKYEDKHREIVKQCNSIEGYVSPCSLWKRPKLCAPLIRKKEKLCCDIPKYGRVNVDYSTDVDPYQAFSNVRKRVEYCSPSVELPPDQYRTKLEQIVGKSAFNGAGSLQKIVRDESEVGASNSLTEGAIKGVAMSLAAVMPFVAQSMF